MSKNNNTYAESNLHNFLKNLLKKIDTLLKKEKLSDNAREQIKFFQQCIGRLHHTILCKFDNNKKPSLLSIGFNLNPLYKAGNANNYFANNQEVISMMDELINKEKVNLPENLEKLVPFLNPVALEIEPSFLLKNITKNLSVKNVENTSGNKFTYKIKYEEKIEEINCDKLYAIFLANNLSHFLDKINFSSRKSDLHEQIHLHGIFEPREQDACDKLPIDQSMNKSNKLQERYFNYRQKIDKLYGLIEKMHKKFPETAKMAEDLCDIINKFSLNDRDSLPNHNAYFSFKSQFNDRLSKEQDLLNKHPFDWKIILANFAIGLFTLGIALGIKLAYSKLSEGRCSLFFVKTEKQTYFNLLESTSVNLEPITAHITAGAA